MPSPPAFLDPTTAAGRTALVEALRAGEVAAVATDTVPGLAVLAGATDGAARLAALKQAPAERPFSIHLRGAADLRRFLPALPPGLAAWLAARLPGPLTVVLPRAWVGLPASWQWPWPEVGLRLPGDHGYLALAAELPEPLLMTSINAHGEPPLHGVELARWLAARPRIRCGLRPELTVAAEPSAVVAFEPLPRVRRGRCAASDLRLGLRVLVVCSGNICRSPLAAALLESELAAAWGVAPADLQELGWILASAGTFGLPGAPASEHSREVARELGLDLERHVSRHLDELAGRPWDRVLVMARAHLAALPAALRERAELFDPDGVEVPDPFGADLAAYRAMREQVVEAAAVRLRAWSAWP